MERLAHAEAGGGLSFQDLDVDDVLFELLERVQRLEAPRSGRLLNDSGFTYAAYCKCGSLERTFEPIELDEAPGVELHRWICAECDALWVFNVGEIAVGEVRIPKGLGLDHHLAEIEQLSNALKLLTKWEARLYLQLYLWEDLGDRLEIATKANRRWRVSRWSEWTVRQTISSAQKKIHRALGLQARARRKPTWQLEDHRL